VLKVKIKAIVSIDGTRIGRNYNIREAHTSWVRPFGRAKLSARQSHISLVFDAGCSWRVFAPALEEASAVGDADTPSSPWDPGGHALFRFSHNALRNKRYILAAAVVRSPLFQLSRAVALSSRGHS